MLDRYDTTLVLKIYTAAWVERLEEVIALVREQLKPVQVVVRYSRNIESAAKGARSSSSARCGQEHAEQELCAPVVFAESGIRFEADVWKGQKTGFFLDQRGNRALVAELSSGARVLNLFAYTGGFSVACGRAGAAQVTSVDLAPAAVAAADQHWRDNGLAARAHRAVTADCFDFLTAAARAGERWDVVIVDPPSFAASEAARPGALAAYQRLNQAALAVTAADGVLVAASCSSHITESDLRDVMAAVAVAGQVRVPIVATRGHDPDHPTLPGFPEGRYLKLLVGAVQGLPIPLSGNRGGPHKAVRGGHGPR